MPKGYFRLTRSVLGHFSTDVFMTAQEVNESIRYWNNRDRSKPDQEGRNAYFGTLLDTSFRSRHDHKCSPKVKEGG